MWNSHDDADWTVPVDLSRAAVGQLRAWGDPINHTEASGGGHSTTAFRLQAEREAWLAAQARDPAPRRVRHTAWTPDRGRAFWVEILEWADPNRPASVDARAAVGNALYLTTRNVRGFARRAAGGAVRSHPAAVGAGRGRPAPRGRTAAGAALRDARG